MGRERVRLDLRRILAAGRSSLRLLRSTPGLHHRHHPLHARQHWRGRRADGHADDHHPCGAGHRWRHTLAGHAHDHRHDLPRSAPAQGHRRVERGRGRGRRGRRSSRRHPDRLGVVALGLLHQRALRHRRRRRRRHVPARDAQPWRHHQARRHRIGAGDRRPRVGDLRGGEHDDAQLGRHRRRSVGSSWASHSSRRSSSGKPRWRRTRSCRSRSFGLDRSRRPI